MNAILVIPLSKILIDSMCFAYPGANILTQATPGRKPRLEADATAFYFAVQNKAEKSCG
jgi:hypothetical protein